MESEMLLYITLILYLMVLTFGYLFKFKWLMMLVGLLWFIPIIEIDNMFIRLIGVIMIIVHVSLGLTNSDTGGFE